MSKGTSLSFVLVLLFLATEASSSLWSQRGVLEGRIEYADDDPTVLIADPPVPRPDEESCNIPLYDYQFNSYDAQPFNFTIPQNCMGNWSKVVLNVEIGCSAGRQFDRTLSIYLIDPEQENTTHIFTGTTPEPRENLAPSVTVELDITQYSSLLKATGAAGTGLVDLGTVVNSEYNGVPQSTASIDVYLAKTSPAPYYLAPSNVLGLGNLNLNNASQVLESSVNLPQQTTGVWLEVTAQGQIGDEFWWSCTPTESKAANGACQNSAFRMLIVKHTGAVAGVYPLFPYLFTGGVNPYLWQPTPGVQTLNLQPIRIDLTGVMGPGFNDLEVSIGGMDSETQFNPYWYVAANILYQVDESYEPQDQTEIDFNTLVGDHLFPIITESSDDGSYFASVVFEAKWTHAFTFTLNGEQQKERYNYYFKFSNIQTYESVGEPKKGVGFSYSTVTQTVELRRNCSGIFPWANSFSLTQTLSNTNNITASKDLSETKFETDTDMQLGWYYDSIAPSSYSVSVKNTVESHVDSVVTNTSSLPGPRDVFPLVTQSSNTGHSTQAYFFLDSKGNVYSRTVASQNNIPLSNITTANSMQGWADPYWGRTQS